MNCGHELDESDTFCSSCGASVIRRDISLWYLIRDSFSTLIDWEQGTLRTFRDLLLDPGKVVRFYWDGGRKRYVEPLRFYFITYILYQFYILITDERLFFIAFIAGFHSGAGEGILTGEEQGRMQLLVEVSTVLFSLILPIMALASSAAFSNLKRSYTEHIVLNSYLIGQLLLFSVLFDLLSDIPMLETAGVLVGFGFMAVYVAYTVIRSLDISAPSAIGGMALTTFLGFILNAILFGVISAIVL